VATGIAFDNFKPLQDRIYPGSNSIKIMELRPFVSFLEVVPFAIGSTIAVSSRVRLQDPWSYDTRRMKPVGPIPRGRQVVDREAQMDRTDKG